MIYIEKSTTQGIKLPEGRGLEDPTGNESRFTPLDFNRDSLSDERSRTSITPSARDPTSYLLQEAERPLAPHSRGLEILD